MARVTMIVEVRERRVWDPSASPIHERSEKQDWYAIYLGEDARPCWYFNGIGWQHDPLRW